MAYQIDWSVPDKVLSLKLIDEISVEELHRINDEVNYYLDQHIGYDHIALAVDIDDVTRLPRDVTLLRQSQTYVNRDELKWIFIVGKNKSVRLILLLTYHLGKSFLQFADNQASVHKILNHVRL